MTDGTAASRSPGKPRAVMERIVSGRSVASGILALGMVFTVILWVYTDFHTRPFVGLRDAIEGEFPGSSPQVEGGQRKMHKGTPRILRITLRVSESPWKSEGRLNALVDRLAQLADTHHGLSPYETLDIYLVWYRPEREAVSRHIQRDVASLVESGLVERAMR